MTITTDDRHIIINYHHVANPSPERVAFYPCPTAEFRRQVAFLSGAYKIVSVSEVAEAARREEAGRFAAITFDDGLRSQYENAVSILEEHKATATFFPVTATWEGFVPAQHKGHLALSLFGTENLATSLQEFLARENLAERFPIPHDRRIVPNRRLHDDVLTANLKETLALLPHEAKEEFFSELFKGRDLDEPMLAKELFMQPEEVKSLSRRGFTIGSHTHRHLAADTISPTAFEEELDEAGRRIKEATGIAPTVFSYPSGRAREDGAELLAPRGFTHAATIERRALSRDDDPFRLPRFDANDLRDFVDGRAP